MKLTYNQEYALKKIVRDPDNSQFGWGSGCTNRTASALKKRGLVRLEFDHAKSCIGFPWSRWVATPAGIELVGYDL